MNSFPQLSQNIKSYQTNIFSALLFSLFSLCSIYFAYDMVTSPDNVPYVNTLTKSGNEFIVPQNFLCTNKILKNHLFLFILNYNIRIKKKNRK